MNLRELELCAVENFGRRNRRQSKQDCQQRAARQAVALLLWIAELMNSGGRKLSDARSQGRTEG